VNLPADLGNGRCNHAVYKTPDTISRLQISQKCPCDPVSAPDLAVTGFNYSASQTAQLDLEKRLATGRAGKAEKTRGAWDGEEGVGE